MFTGRGLKTETVFIYCAKANEMDGCLGDGCLWNSLSNHNTERGSQRREVREGKREKDRDRVGSREEGVRSLYNRPHSDILACRDGDFCSLNANLPPQLFVGMLHPF